MIRLYKTKQNVNCNYLPYTGYTPLITAIRVKKHAIALDLIRFGCQISKPDIQGFTPLDHAAMNDDVTGVKMLLYCALHQDIFNPSSGLDNRCHVSPTTLTFIKSYKLVRSYMESIILYIFGKLVYTRYAYNAYVSLF